MRLIGRMMLSPSPGASSGRLAAASTAACRGVRHVWTAPVLQGDFRVITSRSGAVMCPACLRGTLTAGHDVIRGAAPDQIYDLHGHDTRWVLPFLGLTGRHHAFIALAIG